MTDYYMDEGWSAKVSILLRHWLFLINFCLSISVHQYVSLCTVPPHSTIHHYHKPRIDKHGVYQDNQGNSRFESWLDQAPESVDLRSYGPHLEREHRPDEGESPRFTQIEMTIDSGRSIWSIEIDLIWIDWSVSENLVPHETWRLWSFPPAHPSVDGDQAPRPPDLDHNNFLTTWIVFSKIRCLLFWTWTFFFQLQKGCEGDTAQAASPAFGCTAPPVDRTSRGGKPCDDSEESLYQTVTMATSPTLTGGTCGSQQIRGPALTILRKVLHRWRTYWGGKTNARESYKTTSVITRNALPHLLAKQ